MNPTQELVLDMLRAASHDAEARAKHAAEWEMPDVAKVYADFVKAAQAVLDATRKEVSDV